MTKIKRTIVTLLIAALTFTQLPLSLHADDEFIPGGQTANPPTDPGAAGQTPCQGDSSTCHGSSVPADPVYLDRGEFLYEHTDLTLSGRGINLELKRTYRSNSTYHSQFGYGWDINYNMKIRKMSDGSYLFLTGNNRKETLSASGQGPAGFYDTFTVNPNGTYLLTRKHGDKIYFNQDGNVTRTEDRFGNYLTFTYDPAGRLPLTGPSQYFVNQIQGVVALEFRLTQVSDSLGHSFQFFYDSRGRLDHATDSAGRTTTYGYDGNNDLRSIRSPVTPEYPDGNTIGFTYDTNHNLQTVTNARNQTYVTNTYNAAGKVDTQTLLGRGTTTLTYNTTNHTTDITDRRGFRTLYTYSPEGRPIRREEFTQALRPDDPTSFVTTYNYDSNGELSLITYPRGNKIQNTYDTKGNLLEERKKPIPGHTDSDLVTTYTYEPNFNLIKTVTDPRGNRTTYIYDYELNQGNQGKLIRIDYPTVNGQTIRTSFAYYNFGQINTVTDPNGNITKYTYESSTGYLSTITQSFGTSFAAVTTLTYDAYGNIHTMKDPRNIITTLDQNALHQLKKVTSALHFQTLYDYDPDGNLGASHRQYNNQGTEFQNTIYTYTPHNELGTITQFLGSVPFVTTFQYDNNGNRRKVIDPETRETNYTYDERNLLFTVTDARAGVTQYDYDLNGNLKKIKDANTNPTQYQYDDFDRLQQAVYADSTHESYTYDAASNLQTKLNANNQTIRYTYDELNRLKLKEYLSCPSTTCGGDVHYVYDIGSRLIQSMNSNATLNFGYDSLNRLTAETTRVGNRNYRVASQYDKSGNRTSLSYPGLLRNTIAYYYDSMNRLIVVSDAGDIGRGDIPGRDGVPVSIYGDMLFKLNYDTLSRRISLKRMKSNVITNYSYDTINRMTSITTTPNIIGNISYPLYDKLGNRKEENNQTTPNHNFHFNYNYNTRYELESALDQSQQTHFNYQYDLTGNRTASNEEGNQLTYTPNNLNQYQQVNNQTYQYDNNGNLTNDGTNAYSYDYENRLITVTSGQLSVVNQYDPFGRRLAKQITGNGSPATALFIHDQGQILQTYSCNASLQNCALNQSFIYSNKIDEPLQLTNHQSPTGSYYYHQDALGNTVALTKSDGTLKETYQYDPYGNPHFFNAEGNSIPESTVKNPFLFTGREYDQETGDYYYRARFYSPRLGRFLQRDPMNFTRMKVVSVGSNSNIDSIDFINNPLDLHSLMYSYNNPLNVIDPYGLWSVTLEWYEGWGGGIVFGQNPNGGSFVTFRGGYGLGGGASYDPKGTSPGYDQCSSREFGSSLGLFGEASVGLGPFYYGYGSSGGFYYQMPINLGYYLSQGFSGGLDIGWRLRAGVAIGAELSFVNI